jgi:uncharacterized protein (UPF0305 family)
VDPNKNIAHQPNPNVVRQDMKEAEGIRNKKDLSGQHWSVIPGAGDGGAESLMVIDVVEGTVVGRISARGRLVSHPIVHGDTVSFTVVRDPEADKQEVFGQVHQLPGGALIDQFRVSAGSDMKFEPIFQSRRDVERRLKPLEDKEKELRDLIGKIVQTANDIDKSQAEMRQEFEKAKDKFDKILIQNKGYATKKDEEQDAEAQDRVHTFAKALSQVKGGDKALAYLKRSGILDSGPTTTRSQQLAQKHPRDRAEGYFNWIENLPKAQRNIATHSPSFATARVLSPRDWEKKAQKDIADKAADNAAGRDIETKVAGKGDYDKEDKTFDLVKKSHKVPSPEEKSVAADKKVFDLVKKSHKVPSPEEKRVATHKKVSDRYFDWMDKLPRSNR